MKLCDLTTQLQDLKGEMESKEKELKTKIDECEGYRAT